MGADGRQLARLRRVPEADGPRDSRRGPRARLTSPLLPLLALALIGLALLAIGLQLAIPRVAAGRVREQLTRGGGSAEVRIRALPAIKLLRNSGERIEVRGRDLEIGLGGTSMAGEPGGLSALDGFADVDIELVRFRTGPFRVAAFVLTRSAGGTYAMAAQASAGAGDLARMGAEMLPSVPGAAQLSALGLPLGSREIPVSIQVELESRGGRLQVVSGGGTIAGYPAGPIASALAAAVARRLEIAP